MTSALPKHPGPRRAVVDMDAAAAPGATTGTDAHASGPADARFLAHDARNWLTVLGVYCDLLCSSGAVARGYEPWMEELAGAVERGQALVASLLETVEAAGRTEDERHGEGTEFDTASTPQPDSGSNYWPASLPVFPGDSPLLFPTGSPAKAARSLSSADDVSSSLDVADAIARRLPLFERLAGRDIRVELDAPAHAGNVDMTESVFERILQNLVGNAIEAMPRGGRLRIALRCRSRRADGLRKRAASQSRSETLLLRVSDTGAGIAPEALPRIFDAGVSGKAERGGQRRGLGLAIVRELTERAQGTVRVRSHPGRGSCFEIELPRQAPPR